jgi:hypothetical protein
MRRFSNAGYSLQIERTLDLKRTISDISNFIHTYIVANYCAFGTFFARLGTD